MTQDTVVTSLRIPKPDWLEMRALAAEAQMSLNEYINYIIEMAGKARQFGVSLKIIPTKPRRRDPIWDLPNAVKKLKIEPMGLSADDEIIYG